MKINKIQLEYAVKSNLNSSSYDKIRHVKTLPYLSVVQAVVGNYDIQLGNGRMCNTGNEGFFIAPSNIQQTIIHNADPSSKYMVCRWVFLKIRINDLYDWDDLYDFPVIIPETHKKEMNALFDRLFSADDLFDECVYYHEIVRVLSRLARKKEQTMSPYLNRAIAYMKENFRNRVSVKDIAEEVNLSEAHLYAVFKKELDASPITYLNSYRLSVAADILIKTDKTVTEIADTVGIRDCVYFNKMFKKAYQMPPSKYRNLYKNGRE